MSLSSRPFCSKINSVLKWERSNHVTVMVCILCLSFCGCATITAGRLVLDGDEQAAKGRDDDAISIYSKALEADPQSVEAYKGRGIAYSRKKQHDKALADFSKAVEIDPNDFRSLYYCGSACVQLGRDDDAMDYLTKSIERLETQPPGRLAGTYSDGKRTYSRWTSFTNPMPYYFRGYVFYRKKQYDKANTDLTRAINIDAAYTNAYVLRGFANRDSGDKDKACADWKKACELGDCKQYQAMQKEGYCK